MENIDFDATKKAGKIVYADEQAHSRGRVSGSLKAALLFMAIGIFLYVRVPGPGTIFFCLVLTVFGVVNYLKSERSFTTINTNVPRDLARNRLTAFVTMEQYDILHQDDEFLIFTVPPAFRDDGKRITVIFYDNYVLVSIGKEVANYSSTKKSFDSDSAAINIIRSAIVDV